MNSGSTNVIPLSPFKICDNAGLDFCLEILEIPVWVSVSLETAAQTVGGCTLLRAFSHLEKAENPEYQPAEIHVPA